MLFSLLVLLLLLLAGVIDDSGDGGGGTAGANVLEEDRVTNTLSRQHQWAC